MIRAYCLKQTKIWNICILKTKKHIKTIIATTANKQTNKQNKTKQKQKQNKKQNKTKTKTKTKKKKKQTSDNVARVWNVLEPS